MSAYPTNDALLAAQNTAEAMAWDVASRTETITNAVQIFLQAPLAFGGLCLRGHGPARDALIEQISSALPPSLTMRKIPINVDQDRLLGGLDLTATLAAGKRVDAAGILGQAEGGIVIIPIAERMQDDIAAHLATALDRRDIAVILLDDSVESDEAPPMVLMERIAFHCDCTAMAMPDNIIFTAPAGKVQPSLSDEQRQILTGTAAALGISSLRPLLFAQRAAMAHADIHQRSNVDQDDIAIAATLVLAPRATQLPQIQAEENHHEPPPDDEQQDNQPEDPQQGDNESQNIEQLPDDMMIDAALAAIPAHMLDHIGRHKQRSGNGPMGRAGQKRKSVQRGRPLSPRPGMPGHGAKLALIDTLRAAAPWQGLRRSTSENTVNAAQVYVRKSDLHIKRFEQSSETLTIFAVDASGSSAMSRLAEAKGAVELMLAEAYVKRAQVALIAFRGTESSLLLPPTRSLTRAQRCLGALPGGGGTPLASALIMAHQMALAAQKRGQSPMVAILTDGKANVMLDGTAHRAGAMEESERMAKMLTADNINAIVLDISPRPREEARILATALGARCVPLPRANSGDLVAAIESVGHKDKAA
ncbi:magnesium chelatase subunit D [Parasphingorhabdus sp. DH2-15]|uniref:magnesium chelatase subunit D n=1 Tax=Parasphingorhabdus sp. DH2-15 TaxID=3444112 RepID=UPI003F682B53